VTQSKTKRNRGNRHVTQSQTKHENKRGVTQSQTMCNHGNRDVAKSQTKRYHANLDVTQ